jgi:bifunctional DNA-binding transcriptional regulator/antitoxin component of YhaV-PrlF toxin-antitoxin module
MGSLMSTGTVSGRGQCVIPAVIRQRLGMAAGWRRDVVLMDDAVLACGVERARPKRAGDGRSLPIAEGPGQRNRLGFDVADAMRRGAA